AIRPPAAALDPPRPRKILIVHVNPASDGVPGFERGDSANAMKQSVAFARARAAFIAIEGLPCTGGIDFRQFAMDDAIHSIADDDGRIWPEIEKLSPSCGGAEKPQSAANRR